VTGRFSSWEEHFTFFELPHPESRRTRKAKAAAARASANSDDHDGDGTDDSAAAPPPPPFMSSGAAALAVALMRLGVSVLNQWVDVRVRLQLCLSVRVPRFVLAVKPLPRCPSCAAGCANRGDGGHFGINGRYVALARG